MELLRTESNRRIDQSELEALRVDEERSENYLDGSSGYLKNCVGVKFVRRFQVSASAFPAGKPRT